MAIITPGSDEFKSAISDLSKKSINALDQESKAKEVREKQTKLLESINENLKKIHESLGKSNRSKKEGGGRDSPNEEEKEITLKDELKSFFGSIKSFGKGVKESVKSNYYTKPDAAPVMSSAETLEAKDALNQPKQVEIDQLKTAEETSETQKEILKELKKLNQTTEDKSSGSGGSPSLPDLPGKIGKAGKASTVGKAASTGSKLGMGAVGGVAAGAAAVGLVGGLAYLGFKKESQIAETKDEAAVKKADMDQRLQSGSASIEEAAGSGLSKEDDLFQSTFLSPKPASTAPALATQPASTAPTPATKIGGAIAASAAPAAAGTASDTPSASKKASPEVEAKLSKFKFNDTAGKDSEEGKIRSKVRQSMRGEDVGPLTPLEQAYADRWNEKNRSGGEAVYNQGKGFEGAGSSVTEAVSAKGAGSSVTEAALDSSSEAPRIGSSAKPTTTPTTAVTGSTPAESSTTGTADNKFVYNDKVDPNSEEGKIRAKVRQHLRGEDVGPLTPVEEKYMKEMDEKQRSRGEAVYNQASVSPAPTSTSDVAQTSVENQSLRDEISTSKGSTQPIVSNNVTNTSTNNYIPIKADPRPNNRGSALDNYIGRVSTY